MNDRMTRVLFGLVALLLAGGGVWFVSSGMGGLSENLVYYWSPTELVQAGPKAYTATVRLGGMVEPGSKTWDPENQLLDFRVTDGTTTVPVHCTGAPPAMFREGIGVVVEGHYSDTGVFETDRVLVKHGNEYRVPEDGAHPGKAFESLAEDAS